MRGALTLLVALCMVGLSQAQTVTFSAIGAVNVNGVTTQPYVSVAMTWDANVTYRCPNYTDCFSVTAGTVFRFQRESVVLWNAWILPSAPLVPVTVALKNIFDENNTVPINVTNTFTFVQVRTPPNATYSSPQMTAFGYTNASTVDITVKFTQQPDWFNASNVAVSPFLTPVVTPLSSTQFTITLNLTVQTTYTVTLERVTDLAFQLLEGPDTVYSFVYDTTPVTASYFSPEVDAVGGAKGSSIDINVTFSEEVAAFTSANVIVSPSLTPIVTQSTNLVYTITLAPTTQTLYTVTLVGVADKAGNPQPADNTTYLFGYDVAPTVVYACPQVTASGRTNQSNVVITVNFSEDVNGFPPATVTVDPSVTPTIDAINASSYTITLALSAQGLYTVTLNGVFDLRGSALSSNTVYTFTYDSLPPTATYTSSQLDANGVTRVSPVTYTVTFTEPIVSFTSANLALLPQEPVVVTKVSSTVYTVSISPANQGFHSVVLFGVTDAFGNAMPGNNVSFAFGFDTVGPAATYSSAQVNSYGFAKSGPVVVRVTFSKPVASFADANVAVTNGGAASVSAVTAPTSYDISVTVSAQGTYQLTLSNVFDSLGNGLVNKTYSFGFDTVAPQLSFPAFSNFVNTPVPTLQLNFSERVKSFTADNIATWLATVLSVSPKANPLLYDISFNMTGGSLPSQLYFSGIEDLAGNAIVPFFRNVSLDQVAPVCTIYPQSRVLTNYTNLSNQNFVLNFSKDIVNWPWTNSDNIAGLSGTYLIPRTQRSQINFAPSTSSSNPVNVRYRSFNLRLACITQYGDGPCGFFVSGARDEAGNIATTNCSFVWNFDSTAPRLVSLVGTSPPFVNFSYCTSSTPVITATFTEPVTLSSATQILVPSTAGTITSFLPSGDGSGDQWAITLNLVKEGPVQLRWFSAPVDRAGNQLSYDARRNGINFTFDATAPLATLTSSDVLLGDLTQKSSVKVRVTFNETVANFAVTDIVVVNGNFTIANVTTGLSYDITVTTSMDGPVSLTVQSSVTDAAGNPIAPKTYSWIRDTTPPTIQSIVVESPNGLSDGGFTNVQTIVLNITFSEVISAFGTNRVVPAGSVTVASVSSQTSARSYLVTLTATGNSAISVSFTNIQDLVGNAYAAATTFSYNYDTIAPSVASIVLTANGLPLLNNSSNLFTNFSSVEAVLTFSEEIVPLLASNVDFVLGTAALHSGSPIVVTANTVFRIVIDNLVDGSVQFSLPNVKDRAGNSLPQTLSTPYIYDSIAPTITFEQRTESAFVSGQTSTIKSFALRLIASEATQIDVTTLNAACSGCTISNFQSNPLRYTFDVTASASGVRSNFDPAKVFFTDYAGNLATAPAAFEFIWETISSGNVSCPSSALVNSSITCTITPLTASGGKVFSYATAISLVLSGFTKTAVDLSFGEVFVFSFSAPATTGSFSILYNIAPSQVPNHILVVDTPDSFQIACPSTIATAGSQLSCAVKGFKGGNQIYYLPPTLASAPAGLAFNPASFTLNPAASSPDYSVTITVPSTTGKYVASVSGSSSTLDIYSVSTAPSVAITCGSQYLQLGGAALSCSATVANGIFVQSSALALTAGGLPITGITPAVPSNSFTFNVATNGSSSASKYTVAASAPGSFEVTVYTTAPTSAVVTCTETYVALNVAASCKIVPKIGSATAYARSTLFTPSANTTFTSSGASGWGFALNELPFTITVTGSVSGPALISSGFATETKATLLTTGTPTYLYLTCPALGVQGSTVSCAANALNAVFSPVFVKSSASDFSASPTSVTGLTATPDYGPAYVVSFSPSTLSDYTVQWSLAGITNVSTAINILPPPSSFSLSCPSSGQTGTFLTCTVTSDSQTVASAFSYTANDGSTNSGTFRYTQGALSTTFNFDVSLANPVAYTITVSTVVGSVSRTASITAYTTPTASQLTITCPDSVTASAVNAQVSVDCSVASSVFTTIPLLGLSASVLAPVAPASQSVAFTTTASTNSPLKSATFTLSTAISGTVTFASSGSSVSDTIAVFGVPNAATSTLVCNSTVVNVGDAISCIYYPRGGSAQNNSRILIDATTVTSAFPSGVLTYSAVSPTSGPASALTFTAAAVAQGSRTLVVGVSSVSITVQQPCSDYASCGGGYVAEETVADLRINTAFPQTQTAIDEFKANFTSDMAAAGVPSDRLTIQSLTPGSVIVNFAIKPASTPTGTSAAAILSSIKSQLNDPSSPLLQGSVTSQSTTLTVQPSVLYVYCTTISPAALVLKSSCPSPSSSSNDGAVIGPAVAIPVAAFVAVAAFFVYKRHQSKKKSEPSAGTELAVAPSAVRIEGPSTSPSTNTWETTNAPLPSSPLSFNSPDSSTAPDVSVPATTAPLLAENTSSVDNDTGAEHSASRSLPLPNVPESTSTEEAPVAALSSPADPAGAVAPTSPVPEDPIAAIHPNDPAELMRQLRSHRSPSPRAGGDSLLLPTPDDGAGRPSAV